MAWFHRFFGRKSASDPLAIWAELARVGRTSKTGQVVNLDNALKVATAFACLRVLSQGVAQVPWKLFREVEVGGLTKIQPARDHPLYDLTATAPNEWTTSFEFRESLVLHAALQAAYVFVSRGVGDRILELVLLDPSRITVVQESDWRLRYFLNARDGSKQEFPARSIWHVRGPSWNGYQGMDILRQAREALGLSLATEESHAKLHEKGVQTSGIYSVDGTLTPEQYKQLRGWIEKENAGAENAGRIMLLDRSAKFLQTALSGIDAQHLETRRFQIEEVCRFFGVMPIMVGYSDKATTYASSEQMFLAHVVHTLSPWYARIEQSADLHLLSPADRARGLYFKFMAAGLLRGAAKDRAEYFSKALGSGGSPAWMTQDEVRGLEELNPMGGSASALPIATNIAPAPAAN